MDESLRHFNPNPTLSANLFSKGLFCWLNPLFKKGRERPLDKEDMYNVCPQDASDRLGVNLEREWDKELRKMDDSGGAVKPSLLKALIRLFGVRYMILGFIVFIEEAVRVGQPLLLGGLIRFFTPESKMTKGEAYLYAMGVSLCAIVIAIAHHPYFFGVTRMGMQMRVACCSLMYKKALRLSNTAMGQTTTGQIVNLMSNDVNRFDQAVIFLHFLWIGPLQAIAVLIVLWYELGPSVLAGFAVLLLLIPVQGSMGKLFSKFRRKTAVHTDERVKVMNEIITGIRVIKMYCWEKPFGQFVEKIRKSECHTMHCMNWIRTCRLLINVQLRNIPYIFAIVVATVALGRSLTAAYLYPCMLGFNIVKQVPKRMFVCSLRYGMLQMMILRRDVSVLLSITESFCTTTRFFFFIGVTCVELRVMRAKFRINSVTSSVWVLAHRILSYVLVSVFVVSGGVLQASVLYIALMYMFLLAYNAIGIVFEGVTRFAEVRVSSGRIQKFLLLEEVDRTPHGIQQSELRPKPDDCSVSVDNLTAKWNVDLEQNTLENITASVKAGQLLAIIGPVGAGKSSLLMAILGELQASSGSVNVKGKIAYVSQQAWVFSGSLRQNIIFGSPYDKARFDRVVRASALVKDLEIMPHGDSTLIGDRGVSLSGGQRARVSLARALYADADVFLLDDPLSAVDAAVGRHIFDKCIQGFLRNKPKILVTHQLQYLTSADCILILNEGKVMDKGTYEELSSSGTDFASLLKTNEEDDIIDSPVSADHIPPSYVNFSSQMSLISEVSDFEPEPVQLQEEEERSSGTVGTKVYLEYFKAGAGCFKFFLLVVFNLTAQTSYIMSDWWLSRWATSEEERLAAIGQHQSLLSQGYNQTNVTIPYVDSHRNIYIFTALIFAVFLFGMVRALLFFRVAVDASQKLHNNMFAKILRSPIGFFDTNPVGRILNRFTKDVGHMDDNLPITFFDFIQCFLLILGIVLVAGIVNPWVFIPTLPLIVLFFYIRHYYLATSRSIKRLEGTCRSPVFSYLSASLQGMHTIRAYSMEDKCHQEFDAHQDLHSEAWFLFLSASRWLAVRLDWLCAVFVTAVTFCAVLSAGSLDAGLVGLSITYAMTLMGMFQWGVRQSAEVENQMISVERVLEYSNLPSEAPLESDAKHEPPSSWPKGGAIQADKVSMQYFPNSPLVLKELTFRIKEKEKVGIVGRTGAGKSSLITCLFRLVEPCGGKLSIDDVDILHMGLHDLRKAISIIPQDPVLFTGALRRNLDPFLQHADEQLWKALEEVQLKSAVEDLPMGLETAVSEGGINFSVGQRQLICLARAILRKNRILMIDEATANVDPQTDELIQQTIRDKFSECTVLTIAHRLHTIMDSDRVMVLSDGCIMEFEHPHLLLQRGSGLLYDMVQQTGKTEAESLAEMAADAYRKYQRKSNSLRRGKSLESPVDQLTPADAEKAVDFSQSNNTPRKAKRRSKKLTNLDDMNLEAPLALAESFHSLLGHGSREDDSESDSTSDPSQEDRASPKAEEAAAHVPEEDPVVLLHPTGQATASAPNTTDPSQNPLNKSALTDTSFDDDVFAENTATETAASPITGRSNFLPVAMMKDKEEKDEAEDEEDYEERPTSELLPHVESGIGMEANVSSSDAEETTSGFGTQLDTPPSEQGQELTAEEENSANNTAGSAVTALEPGVSGTSSLGSRESNQLLGNRERNHLANSTETDQPLDNTVNDQFFDDKETDQLLGDTENNQLLGDADHKALLQKSKGDESGMDDYAVEEKDDPDDRDDDNNASSELDALIVPNSRSEPDGNVVHS